MTRVRVTPSARAALLETVVALRVRDRSRAAAVVERLGRELTALARDPSAAPEMGPPGAAVADPDGLRVYHRSRGGDVWVLAAWWGAEPTVLDDGDAPPGA